MAIYRNIFDPDNDMMLWELHEIRHELHQTLTQQTIEEFNAEAFKKYQQWQKELMISKLPLTTSLNMKRS